MKGILANDRSISPKVAETKLNSSLCRFCRVFFDTWSSVLEIEEGKRYFATAHYETLAQLESSARQGRQMCELFPSKINRTMEVVDIDLTWCSLSSTNELEPKGIMYLQDLNGVFAHTQECWQIGLIQERA